MTIPHPTRRTGLGRSLADIVGAPEVPVPGSPPRRLLPSPAVVPLDLVPFPMLVADPVGRVLAVNQRWVRLTGLDPAQSMGSGWLAALRPEDRSALRSLVQVVGNGREGSYADFPLRGSGSPCFGWWMVAHQRTGERLVGIALGEPTRYTADPVAEELPSLLQSARGLLDALELLVARLPALEGLPV